ncbi:MAG: hypothetical protein GY838_13610 [bacterium]|nr:hypothetical protein [bacterium]
MQNEDEYLEQLARRAAMMRKNKLFGFVPNKPQLDFMENQDNFLLAAIGANKLGKSTLVCVEGISHAMGIRPFFPSGHHLHTVRMPSGDQIRVPNVGQVVAEDYPNGVDKIQWPMWQEWLPRDSFKIAKTERGVIRELWVDVSWCPWADKNDSNYPWSIVYFMAYEQKRKKFAGIDPDWILNDEPPPKAVWLEQIRGLVSTGGKWMGAMTCIDNEQTYIYDIFFPPKDHKPAESDKEGQRTQTLLTGASTHCVTGSMYDNLLDEETGSGGLKKENIEMFASLLTDEERAVRIEGKMLHLIGTEYGALWDSDVHVVPHREPNPDHVQIMAADAHPTKPYAMLWFEIDPHNQVYVYAESFDKSLIDIPMISDEIKQVEGWERDEYRKTWRERSSAVEPVYRLIDPLAQSLDKGKGLSAIQQFAIEHDLYFVPWMRGNKANRIRNVKPLLKRGEGPHALPRLTVSENCRETIFQIPRYRERMPKDPETQERTGAMIPVNDDLVQPIIAVANLNLNFADYESMKWGNRAKIVNMNRGNSTYLRHVVGGW